MAVFNVLISANVRVLKDVGLCVLALLLKEILNTLYSFFNLYFILMSMLISLEVILLHKKLDITFAF